MLLLLVESVTKGCQKKEELDLIHLCHQWYPTWSLSLSPEVMRMVRAVDWGTWAGLVGFLWAWLIWLFLTWSMFHALIRMKYAGKKAALLWLVVTRRSGELQNEYLALVEQYWSGLLLLLMIDTCGLGQRGTCYDRYGHNWDTGHTGNGQ